MVRTDDAINAGLCLFSLLVPHASLEGFGLRKCTVVCLCAQRPHGRTEDRPEHSHLRYGRAGL